MTHTHSKIQLHYFWPRMSDFIRDRITACHKCIARKSPVNRHQPMGHVPVSGRFERMSMDLLDVSVISAKGHKYILVVCDYFTKYTEAYPLADKTARSVADALMDIWLPRYGFPLFLHSDQGKEFDNNMVHKLSELLATVKTKTTPYPGVGTRSKPNNFRQKWTRQKSRKHRPRAPRGRLELITRINNNI